MPLSEHERRILSSLEESLEGDPRFVRSVDAINSPVRRWPVKLTSVLGFVLGLAILVTFFTRSVLLGVIGVALMFGSALLFVETLKRVSRVADFRKRRTK